MTCACGFANPEGMRFCGSCGASLARVCPACGFENPPGFVFCGRCGGAVAGGETSAPRARPPRDYTPEHLAERILQARSALEGERKQVTVLFADVKGSMTLAEGTDAEVFHRVMEQTARLLADGVHRYEGTVTQYTGDGVMALFGAPIAHEDHAQRACYAALHLRETVGRFADQLRLAEGLNLSLRIGLNSGEVVVGAIGDDLRMDYTAQGHTVGLAARMEQIAAADRVYVSAHTARLVEGYFRLRDLGALTIKGASEPVRVYELEDVGAVRTRLEMSRRRGFSRFVGRADEMTALEAALARAVDSHGQVVGLVAEPGVGKSRLCLEFLERCRTRSLPVNETRCVAHGKTIPYLPVLELMRGLHGVTEQDRPQTARDKIAGRLLLLDEGLRESLPLVFDFLGVPDPEQPLPRMDPEARQRQLFAVVRRAVQARSRREPAVVLMEDLQWLDGASEVFVETLVDAIAGTRTLLVVNFRPEYHAGWMQRSYYRQLPLPPLGVQAVEELLRDLLGPDPALAGLTALLRERTGGNPFFVEEVVRSLAESGTLAGERGAYRLARPIDAIELPPTVQSLLAARIDRLGERDKAVLQTAAVIGKEIPEPILARVVALPEAELRAAERALVAAEFFYEQAIYPEVVHAFAHPLTQEVAYRSLLGARRKELHAAVARAIEEAYPSLLDERAALLAHHWQEAGEALVAATWHQRAADWIGVRDRGETLRHWGEVRRLLAAAPESPETLALGVLARDGMLLNGLFVGMGDEQAEALFAEGMTMAARLPEPSARIRLLVRLGVRRNLTGFPLEAMGPLVEAHRIARETGDPLLEFQTRMSLASPLANCGRLDDAIVHVQEAEALCGADPEFGLAFTAFSPYVYLLAQRGGIMVLQGRPAEALRLVERATAIARERRDHEVLAVASYIGSAACEMLGDASGALAHAREATMSVDAGAEGLRYIALLNLGRAHLMERAWRLAVEALAASLATARTGRTGLVQEAWILARLADAHLGAGDLGRARETAEEAVESARRRGTPVYEIAARLARARALLATGAEASAVERDLDDATALVHDTGARAYLAFVHVERARLAALRGDAGARQDLLREAHRLFGEMGAVMYAEEVAAELGGALTASA